MAAGACGLFLAAHGVGMLFAARALQGAAVGTAASALGAALVDLQPEGSAIAPVITIAAGQLGLAAGGLGTSALVQYGPAPTHLVWWLLLGVSLAAAVAVLAMPETVSGRPGVLASLLPRVAVPRPGDLPIHRDRGRRRRRVPRRQLADGDAGRLPSPARRRRDDIRGDRNGIGGRLPHRHRDSG